MAKRFYFVRHGKTFLNESGIKQGAEGGLNDAGKKQAHDVGVALAKLDRRITHIFSSEYERAKETSEIINQFLKVHVTYTPLLAERRNPQEVIGKPYDDLDVQRITGLIEKGFHTDDYRYSDEENFIDLKRRARACLSYLGRRGSATSCVVTHHAFLQMLLSYLLYRDTLTATNYAKLSFFNPADNAGITICEYDPWSDLFGPTHGWKVIAYNQHAGDLEKITSPSV